LLFVYASYGGAVPRRVVRDLESTLNVCRTFAPLPIYWLISNQFSTNVVLQATALNLPSAIAPDAFNNVNTMSLIVFCALLDRLIIPRLYGPGTQPDACSRMCLGFVVVTVAILWCGVLQTFIDHRGTFAANADSDDSSGYAYQLYSGESLISAVWLIPAYVLQGVASVFVDTAAMEAAYTASPSRVKSTVMALYLMASSLSGLLGLLLSPLSEPSWFAVVFFGLAGAQVLVAGTFYIWNPTSTVARFGGEEHDLGEELSTAEPRFSST